MSSVESENVYTFLQNLAEYRRLDQHSDYALKKMMLGDFYIKKQESPSEFTFPAETDRQYIECKKDMDDALKRCIDQKHVDTIILGVKKQQPSGWLQIVYSALGAVLAPVAGVIFIIFFGFAHFKNCDGHIFMVKFSTEDSELECPK